MLRCRVVFGLLVCLAAGAQPLPKLGEYPAHARAGAAEIGAKYLPGGLPFAPSGDASKNFLVVDVAVFPAAKMGLAISKAQFTLAVNDKLVLSAQTHGAGTTAGSLIATDSSTKSGAVELGGPPITHVATKQPVEAAMPRRPIALDPEPDEPSATTPARKAALPEGFTDKPVTGYLYFRFDGDRKSIHSLELTYGVGANKTRLRIF